MADVLMARQVRLFRHGKKINKDMYPGVRPSAELMALDLLWRVTVIGGKGQNSPGEHVAHRVFL